MKKTKDVVIGLGEIGMPIYKLLSKFDNIVDFDIDKSKMNIKKYKKNLDTPVSFLHICIPFGKNYVKSVVDICNENKPQCIVIHSTIEPYTTKKLQTKLDIPIIYNVTRGVHKRMLSDLKKYTKFYALEKNAPKKQWASLEFSKLMKKCGVKTKKLSDTITLELAKIVVDTLYYGWLINYAQISNLIAKKHKVDFDEMWSFSDEI